MTTYDPQILYEFANRLYARANQVIATYTVLGALVGGGAGFSVNQQFDVYTLLGAALVGLVAYLLGVEKAFQLKLQAQTALCQVKIEENTRTK